MREIQTGLHKPEGATKQRLTKSADNSAPVCFPNCASICLGSRVSFDLPLALIPITRPYLPFSLARIEGMSVVVGNRSTKHRCNYVWLGGAMRSEAASTSAQDLSFAIASVQLSTMSSTRCRFVNWKISRREGPIPKKTTLPFWRSIRRLIGLETGTQPVIDSSCGPVSALRGLVIVYMISI